MGLKFENWQKRQELFRAWTEKNGNEDELEEIRITVIDADVRGDEPRYFIHIGADAENSMIRATAEGIVIEQIPFALFGQIQRMCPLPENAPMLPKFKELVQRHGEFLFAPVTPRDDGQFWVDLPLGIVKRAVHFRQIGDAERGLAQAIDEFLKTSTPN